MSESISIERMEIEPVSLGQIRRRAMALEQVPEAEWKRQKVCRIEDVDLFFGETEDDIAEAKAKCATCIVSLNCLRFALDNQINHGVWGGLSETERKTVQRLRGSNLPKFADYID